MAEEYRASAMRPLPQLEIVRMVISNVTIDVVHCLARQQLASVNILPDVQVHRPAVTAKGYHRVPASSETVGRAATSVTPAFACALQLDRIISLRPACMLYLNNGPLAEGIAVGCRNPFAAGKHFTLYGRLYPVHILRRSVATNTLRYLPAIGDTVTGCVVSSQHGVTAGSKAIHIIHNNTSGAGKENMFEHDTNLRAMRNYAQRLKTPKGESPDMATVKLLESVLA